MGKWYERELSNSRATEQDERRRQQETCRHGTHESRRNPSHEVEGQGHLALSKKPTKASSQAMNLHKCKPGSQLQDVWTSPCKSSITQSSAQPARQNGAGRRCSQRTLVGSSQKSSPHHRSLPLADPCGHYSAATRCHCALYEPDAQLSALQTRGGQGSSSHSVRTIGAGASPSLLEACSSPGNSLTCPASRYSCFPSLSLSLSLAHSRFLEPLQTSRQPAMYSRLDHVHTALEAVGEVSLATTTSKDLGLDDDGSAKRLGLGLGLGGRERWHAAGGGDAILPLALISTFDSSSSSPFPGAQCFSLLPSALVRIARARGSRLAARAGYSQPNYG